MSRVQTPAGHRLFCAYPLLNHVAAVYGEPRWAALGVALVAWGLTAGWLSAVSSVLGCGRHSRRRAVLPPFFPGSALHAPVVINLALCVFFARTLGPGRGR